MLVTVGTGAVRQAAYRARQQEEHARLELLADAAERFEALFGLALADVLDQHRSRRDVILALVDPWELDWWTGHVAEPPGPAPNGNETRVLKGKAE